MRVILNAAFKEYLNMRNYTVLRMKKETELWWKQSQAEIKTAKILKEQYVYYAACFHAQQAAEQALKALHIEMKNEAYIGHDLVNLSKNLKLPQTLIIKCKTLAAAYQEAKIPGYWQQSTG